MKGHNYTPQEDYIILRVYTQMGIAGTREKLPHLSDNQVRSRAKVLKARAPEGSPKARERYAKLEPLAPADDRPSALDVPTVVRRGLGQWKADIPAVRWVFDLGAV